LFRGANQQCDLLLRKRVDFIRVLVIGAGIIGSIYGWALAKSGHQFVHLMRSGQAAALSDTKSLSNEQCRFRLTFVERC
jgi:ketopantoate reductase